jgi:hypothetical protein
MQQRWPRNGSVSVDPFLIFILFNAAYLVKHILELVLRQRTAFDVFNRAEVLRHTLAVLSADRGHLLLSKLLSDTGVISQIDLSTDNQAGDAWAVVVDLGEPFLADVFERRRGGDAEADEENVGLGI